MNIFTKSKIESILNDKLNSQEIQFYKLSEKTLHIKKSRRCKTTINIQDMNPYVLVRILSKRFPNPQDQNLSDFFKVELRSLQIQRILK
jgi:hypothetical protein